MKNLFKIDFTECRQSTKECMLYIVKQYMNKGFVWLTVNYRTNTHDYGIYCLDNNGINFQSLAFTDDWTVKEKTFNEIMSICAFLKLNCNMEYSKLNGDITLTIKSEK